MTYESSQGRQKGFDLVKANQGCTVRLGSCSLLRVLATTSKASLALLQEPDPQVTIYLRHESRRQRPVGTVEAAVLLPGRAEACSQQPRRVRAAHFIDTSTRQKEQSSYTAQV